MKIKLLFRYFCVPLNSQLWVYHWMLDEWFSTMIMTTQHHYCNCFFMVHYVLFEYSYIMWNCPFYQVHCLLSKSVSACRDMVLYGNGLTYCQNSVTTWWCRFNTWTIEIWAFIELYSPFSTKMRSVMWWSPAVTCDRQCNAIPICSRLMDGCIKHILAYDTIQ